MLNDIEYAPIALMVYDRPWHTKNTIEALKKNKLSNESDIFIFSDAAKNNKSKRNVEEVRNYIREIDGFKSISIIERKENYGLSKSILSGVTDVLNRYGKVIVLEDDLDTSKYFLDYINKALTFYKDNENVISISGYMYPLKTILPETFFIRGADCWGWATWKDKWTLFEADGEKLLKWLQDDKLERMFDFNGAYKFSKMLKDQIKGRNDSWAIRWYASAFLSNKFTLYPGRSLVNNIGFDDSGVHCGTCNYYDVKLSDRPIIIDSKDVTEDIHIRSQMEYFYRSIKPNLFKRVKNKVIKRLNYG